MEGNACGNWFPKQANRLFPSVYSNATIETLKEDHKLFADDDKHVQAFKIEYKDKDWHKKHELKVLDLKESDNLAIIPDLFEEDLYMPIWDFSDMCYKWRWEIWCSWLRIRLSTGFLYLGRRKHDWGRTPQRVRCTAINQHPGNYRNICRGILEEVEPKTKPVVKTNDKE